MPRRGYLSPERFDSFIAEQISSYEKIDGAPPFSAAEYRAWTNEELSRIRRELHKLTALRVLNATDAEDIVQDTLLTLIHSCPQNELEKGPLVWSIGVLRNKIGNYYRKGRHRAKSEEREAKLQQGLFQTVSEASPEREFMRGELRNVITDAVERLPQAQKTAMKMLIEGLSPGQIASRMSPERYQTVINHLHRGRKKIAQELALYGFSGRREMKRDRSGKKPVSDKEKAAKTGDAGGC